jgi:hypothetical protein
LSTFFGFDKFLRAERIEIVEDTENVQRFLEKVTLYDISKKETYKDL